MSGSAPSRTLIAGIGNIFLGDDGFGCEVVRALEKTKLPSDVRVVDYGIRGLDLAYALLEPYRAIVLVDSVSRGAVPGTVFLLQPSNGPENEMLALDPHSMDPLHVLAMARSLGEISAEVFIVGCQPGDFGDEYAGRMGLSSAIAASVPEAVRAVSELVARLNSNEIPAHGLLSNV
jgi:hydrogenase maturation protease